MASRLFPRAIARKPVPELSDKMLCANSGHYLAGLQSRYFVELPVAHSGKMPLGENYEWLFRAFQKLVDRRRKSRKGLRPDDALAVDLLRCRLRDNERRRAGDPELLGLGGVVFD